MSDSSERPKPERIFYSSSVHDEREIEAVVEVLRSGPQGLWPGRRVTAMEREVAALFGKARGRDVQLRARRRCTSRSSCSTCRRAPRSSPAR